MVDDDSLKEFSQDNSKYGFINLPDDKFRLFDQEIMGSDEWEKQEKKKLQQIAPKTEEKSTEPTAEIKDDDMDFTANRYTVSGKAPQDDHSSSEDENEKEEKKEETSQFGEFTRDARSSSLFKARRPTKVTLRNF